MNEELAALRKASKDTVKSMVVAVARRNGDLEALLRSEGFSLKYDMTRDHLYVTIGEAREGVALLLGDMVIIVDQGTMDLLSVEIPDFRKGSIPGGWKNIADAIAEHGDLDLCFSPDPSDANQTPLGYAGEVASGLRRELTLA